MSTRRFKQAPLDRFFDFMENAFPVIWVVGAIAMLAFWGVVVFVLIHFLSKVW